MNYPNDEFDPSTTWRPLASTEIARWFDKHPNGLESSLNNCRCWVRQRSNDGRETISGQAFSSSSQSIANYSQRWLLIQSLENRQERETPDLTDMAHDQSIKFLEIPIDTLPPTRHLHEASAVELRCWSRSERKLDVSKVVWPLDIDGAAGLRNKIRFLREAITAGGKIGLSLPLLNLSQDHLERFTWLRDVELDWITWRLPSAVLGIDHPLTKAIGIKPEEAVQQLTRWWNTTAGMDSSTQKQTSDAHLNEDAVSIAKIVIEDNWKDAYQASLVLIAGAAAIVMPAECELLSLARSDVYSTSQNVDASSAAKHEPRSSSNWTLPSMSPKSNLGMPFSFSGAMSSSNSDSKVAVPSNSPLQVLDTFVADLESYLNFSV